MDDYPRIPSGLCDLVIVSPASGWFWLDVAAAGLVQDEGWASSPGKLYVRRPHGMPGCILLISMGHLQHRLLGEGASTDLEPYRQSL